MASDPPSRPPLPFAEARGVSKVFGRQRALHQVDLKLHPGRVTALLGPNGSGKTTLLSLFSTLSRPTSGTMHFGELPPERAKEARGAIGLLSHHAMAYGDLSALENVTFYARLYEVKEPQAQAEALLREFGLEDAMHRAAGTFSRGMLQRLGLARALVSAPSLVLLDEPFTGLDQRSCQRVVEKVRALREQGAMVLLVSHDLGLVADLADEAVLLTRGRVRHQLSGWESGEALRAAYAEHAEGAAG